MFYLLSNLYNYFKESFMYKSLTSRNAIEYNPVDSQVKMNKLPKYNKYETVYKYWIY